MSIPNPAAPNRAVLAMAIRSFPASVPSAFNA
jgi:hypothetical protein